MPRVWWAACEITIVFIFLRKIPGHIQVLKNRNKEFFHLWNYFLNKVVARHNINAGYCASRGLGPRDKIDQVQTWTKLCNFGWAATRTKTHKVAGIRIHSHMDLCWIQELDFTLSSLNTLWIRLLYVTLTKGPSKRYTNLVLWSRPRVNNVCAWISSSCL
jgi:hypothetical protein